MFRLPFWRSAQPLSIHLDELDRKLGLSKHLNDDPDYHIQLLQMLERFTIRGSDMEGPARTRFSHPDQFYIQEYPEPAFSDLPKEEPTKIKSSSVIATTEENAGLWGTTFRLMIAGDITPERLPKIEKNHGLLHEIANMMMAKGAPTHLGPEKAVIFALEGTFGKDRVLKIHTIRAPHRDKNTKRLSDVQPIPLNEHNLNLALEYAKLCAKAIYNGEKPMPSLQLNQAEHKLKTAYEDETSEAFIAPPVSLEKI